MKYAEVSWTINDIIGYTEDWEKPLTEEEAANFLERYEDALIEGMVEYGWNIIDNAVAREGLYSRIGEE